jgi:hypothetical protein
MSEANGLAPCCANCRFYVVQDDRQSTCKRYAPRPAQDEAWAEWPRVLPHDWCGEWAQPLSDDELFAEFLARNASAMPLLDGIPVPPTDDQPEPKAPQVRTYDDPFTDPLL